MANLRLVWCIDEYVVEFEPEREGRVVTPMLLFLLTVTIVMYV